MTRLRHDPPCRRAARRTDPRTLTAAPDYSADGSTAPDVATPADVPAGDPWNGGHPFPPPLALRLGPRSWRRLVAAGVTCAQRNRPQQ